MSNILIIDDEELVRLTLRATLEALGHDVEECETGDAGIEQYRAALADLVMVDIMMPGKSGLDTIRELREINPDVRLISISGGGRIGTTNYLAAAKELGADRVLPKPFDFDSIAEAVGEVLASAA